jgi:hypothetical protein
MSVAWLGNALEARVIASTTRKVRGEGLEFKPRMDANRSDGAKTTHFAVFVTLFASIRGSDLISLTLPDLEMS